MQVGILTFNCTLNYGAQLQAFALQETIRQMGANCSHIITFDLTKTDISVKSFVKNIIMYRSRKAFKTFQNKLNTHPGLYNASNAALLLNDFDAFVSGSDQVWNLTGGMDEMFFQTFVDNSHKKVSYAASVGINYIPEKYKCVLTDVLNDFDYISVREETAKKLLQPFCEKQVSRVLDPIFLLPKNTWNSFSKERIHDKYIFVYGTQMTQELMKVALDLKRKTGLKLYSVFPMKGAKTIGTKIGPIEFVSYIRDAQFVVTTSLHCTAFSVLYEKKIIEVLHSSTGSRAKDLLELFGLGDCVYDSSIDYSKYKWNYSTAREILKKEREKSLKFLNSALFD